MMRRVLFCVALLLLTARAALATTPSIDANTGTASSATATTAVSVALTSGVANNTDAVVIVLKTTNTSCSSSNVSTPPTGFSYLTGIEAASNTTCLMIYYANGGQNGNSTFAFTMASAIKYAVVAMEIANQNTSSMWDQTGTQSSGSSTSWTSPSVTPQGANELAISAFQGAPATNTWTETGTYTAVATVTAASDLLQVNYKSNPTQGGSTSDAGTAGSASSYSSMTLTIYSNTSSTTTHNLLKTGAG